MVRPLLGLLIAALVGLAVPAHAQQEPATVIVDASQFLDHLPYEHEITTDPEMFNNFGLRATTRRNPIASATIPESTTYHVYVRSRGGRFRVAVDDRVIDENIEHDTMALRRVGALDLEAGTSTVRVAGIDGTPEIDVIVLSTRDDLQMDDLRRHQFSPEVELLREYDIVPASSVKFGDVTGDGRMDLLVVTDNYSAHVYDHDGNELWSWEAPGTRQHEAPGLVWDINRNGRAEVIHWRLVDGEEWLVVADGPTGEVLHRTPWPTQPAPHDWSNFRLAIGQLSGDEYPATVIVFTDSGRYDERQGYITIAAYDARLNELWRHREDKLKDHLGHYAYPVDLTDNGRDEVVVSSLVLDAEGHEMWNRFDFHFRNQEHMDSMRFADLTGDGQPDIIASASDMGVQAFDALTGELLWMHNAEHAQQVATGDFLAADVRTPHIAIGARTYDPLSAQVWWFSPDGELLSKWPPNQIRSNPVFVKGDWYGDGSEVLFWHRFRMNDRGTGELYFPQPVYHMFDFTGNGAEEVITLQGNSLRVYGYREAPENEALRNADYLKNDVANHTHY